MVKGTFCHLQKQKAERLRCSSTDGFLLFSPEAKTDFALLPVFSLSYWLMKKGHKRPNAGLSDPQNCFAVKKAADSAQSLTLNLFSAGSSHWMPDIF
jgi:hypothetical protein